MSEIQQVCHFLQLFYNLKIIFLISDHPMSKQPDRAPHQAKPWGRTQVHSDEVRKHLIYYLINTIIAH